MKKIVSFIICISVILSTFVYATAVDSVDARLYNVYGNGMLFQQNEDAVLAGTGNAGDEIKCSLKNKLGSVVAEALSKVDNNGLFKISFKAPAGSYEEYTITMESDGQVFDVLENIVFGELWLSGGQSNMQIELQWSVTGKQMLADGTRGSKNVRYFYSAPSPEYNGDTYNLPYYPQTEIPGCCWFDGTDDRIFNISATGYFFAEKLQKELDMPVGLLSGSLGGSSITAWIPRSAIDGNRQVINDLGTSYYSKKEWKEDGSISIMNACSGMYNKKIAPLGNFRPAGMIWYQGESDSGWEHGKYSRLFDVLQDSYSDLFDYDGVLPVVFTSLCDFSFGDIDGFKRMSSEFADMQKSRPESRSIISVSDIPLTYYIETQACHPADKKPVGERMAYAAQGLVYGEKNCVSAPNLKSYEIKDNSVYLTYNYCGDTLKAKGERIYGFTICGKDGVYVPADAEIVSNDTVRVYSENIEKPKAVMYANGLITSRCNLYAYKDGEYVWPVLPTITDWSYIDNIWTDFGWTDCDTPEIWREESLTIAGNYEIWEGNGADVSVTSESAFKGNGGLKITGNNSFSVSPITKYVNENNEENIFLEFNQNWQNYKKMSVMVRNDGENDIVISNVKIIKDNGKWVAPVVDGTKSTSATIPADGEWHEIVFNMNTLYFSGKRLPAAASRTYLTDVSDVEFCFDGENARLSMDEISFETSGMSSPIIKLMSYDPVSLLFNLVSTIAGFFSMLANK